MEKGDKGVMANHSHPFEAIDTGCFSVKGDLTFHTVMTIYPLGLAALKKHAKLNIDLSNVARCDSAGLALLVEWVVRAKANQCDIIYLDVPEQLRAIASVSHCEALLPMAK